MKDLKFLARMIYKLIQHKLFWSLFDNIFESLLLYA